MNILPVSFIGCVYYYDLNQCQCRVTRLQRPTWYGCFVSNTIGCNVHCRPIPKSRKKTFADAEIQKNYKNLNNKRYRPTCIKKGKVIQVDILYTPNTVSVLTLN